MGTHGKVVAMDIQAGMLSRVREKAQKANLATIDYLEAGLGEGKLKHNTFDCVLLVAVLGEIPDQGPALKEIFDALKPCGIFSITETIFDPHYQRKNTVLKLTKALGFQEKSQFGGRLAYTLLLEKPCKR